MNYEVYCDESCAETLVDASAHQYMLLGSLWLPVAHRAQFKDSIKQIKRENNYNLEIKWNKVSPVHLVFYRELVEYFFSTPELRFRSLVIASKEVNIVKFHSGDAELGFYKFYYQMIHHWILDFNEYSFFLDYKSNKNSKRLSELKNYLSRASITSTINQVQSIHSQDSLGIQLADFLLGAVNAKFNNVVKANSAKSEIIKLIESKISKSIEPTDRNEYKFNIFRIKLQGGW